MTAAPFGYGKVRASFTDVGLLIGRLTIGLVVFVHGWQKLTQMGYGGVVEMLNGVGGPLPQISAALLILLELVGSVALAVGVVTRVVAVLMAINMAGAVLLLHLQNGFFVADGGYELALMIGGASLIYAFAGAGRLSVDALLLLFFVRRGQQAAASATAEAGEMLSGLRDDRPTSDAGKPTADAEAKPAPATGKSASAPTKAAVPTPSTPKAAAEPKPESKPETPTPAKPVAGTPRSGTPTPGTPRPGASGSAAAGSAPTNEGPRHEASAEDTSDVRSDAPTAEPSRR